MPQPLFTVPAFIAAGIGNVYKCELLFVSGLSPDTVLGEVSAERLYNMYVKGHEWLVACVERGRRVTTDDPRDGKRFWVYDRAKQYCRRCADIIGKAKLGAHDRVTYWCPSCQRESKSNRSVDSC